LTVDDRTLLSNHRVRLPLSKEKRQRVNVFSAYVVAFPFVTSNLRTPAKVEQAVRAHWTIRPNGTYIFRESIDIVGLSLTPSKTGVLHAAQRKFELLYFGFVAQWEAFRGAKRSSSY
jgi:hypothetical protein